MKIIDKPFIQLEDSEIKLIKEIHKLIKDMPCENLLCKECPFISLCEYLDMTSVEASVFAIQDALKKAIMK